MRIALISDTHIGFGQGERRKDAVDQAREAFQLALERKVDLILLLGDIFHLWTTRRLEDLAEVLGLLSLAKQKNVEVVAIAGNHEARGGLNILQAIEKAGVLKYLDLDSFTFEKDGERVVIHGMGYRDESKAKNTLKLWSPKPVEGAFNILALHQAVGDYMFAGIRELELSDLPKGFDLYAVGHVHLRAEGRVYRAPLLFPGSTIQTQLSKEEEGTPKGFFVFDTSTRKWEFVEIPTRDFYYIQLEVRGEKAEELKRRVKEEVEKVLSRPRKNVGKLPLVRIRILGSLAAGETVPDLRWLEESFKERAIVNLGVELGVAEPVEAEKIRELREKPVSAMDMVMEVFKKKMGAGPMDAGELLKLLVEKEAEEIEEILLRTVEEKVKSSA
jgi:DNA repair exonuclease SbcCD nuclease subunit